MFYIYPGLCLFHKTHIRVLFLKRSGNEIGLDVHWTEKQLFTKPELCVHGFYVPVGCYIYYFVQLEFIFIVQIFIHAVLWIVFFLKKLLNDCN